MVYHQILRRVAKKTKPRGALRLLCLHRSSQPRASELTGKASEGNSIARLGSRAQLESSKKDTARICLLHPKSNTHNHTAATGHLASWFNSGLGGLAPMGKVLIDLLAEPHDWLAIMTVALHCFGHVLVALVVKWLLLKRWTL